MKSFFKVLLLVIVALIAIKLLPLTIGLGFAAGVLLVALLIGGLSLVASIVALGAAVAAVLAPVWIPVLLLIGFIALVKRATKKRPVVAA